MTSLKCTICVWTHNLNVSIKYFNVVHFKRQGYKGWWILCRKYLRRTEKLVIKWTHNLKQRYSWKEKQKRKETAAARRQAWSLPFPHTCWTAHTMKTANSVSPQKPEPGLDLGQLPVWLMHLQPLTEGRPQSKHTDLSSLAQLQVEARSLHPSPPGAVNCRWINTQGPHTPSPQWHLPYFSAVHLGLLLLYFVLYSPYVERKHEERKKRNLSAFQLPNHLPQNASCISTDFIICLLLGILFKE